MEKKKKASRGRKAGCQHVVQLCLTLNKFCGLSGTQVPHCENDRVELADSQASSALTFTDSDAPVGEYQVVEEADLCVSQQGVLALGKPSRAQS